MNRNQTILIFAISVFFLFLYFGCDTKNKTQRDLETSRSISLEATSPELVVRSAKEKLGLANVALLEEIEHNIRDQKTDTLKVPYLTELSSKWYDSGYPIVSGYYAEEIAKILNTERSWSIAGTTYALGVKSDKEDKNRSFAAGRAIKAFEKALSINPDNIDHKLNMAICYTDYPPKDNPMQGVLSLLELNKENPENVKILNQLARLGMQTGQWEKALGRLNKAYDVDSTNRTTICMMAEVYKELGEPSKATKFKQKCNFNNF